MTDDSKNAVEQERAMREHEREARERDSDERSGDGGGDGGSDVGNALGESKEGGISAPPGNIPAGGQSG
jgi:hypothetical protein